jgi:hypothetical protein
MPAGGKLAGKCQFFLNPMYSRKGLRNDSGCQSGIKYPVKIFFKSETKTFFKK